MMIYRLMLDLTTYDRVAANMEGLYQTLEAAKQAAEHYYGEQVWEPNQPFNMIYCILADGEGTIGISAIPLKG